MTINKNMSYRQAAFEAALLAALPRFQGDVAVPLFPGTDFTNQS
jgi:hypothetical protein